LGAAAVTKTSAEINDLVEQTDPVLNGTISGTAFLDDDTMAADSAVAVASQQSIKAYVDSLTVVSHGRVPNTLNSVTGPTGWTANLVLTGLCRITHNLGHLNYTVTATAVSSSLVDIHAAVNDKTTTTFNVFLSDTSGAGENTAFDFMVIPD